MRCNTNFIDFISNINIQEKLKNDLRNEQKIITKKLKEDDIGEHIIATFIQGSIARDTSVKQSNDKADVDIVIVTDFLCNNNMNINGLEGISPSIALNKFKGFLDRNYNGKWRMQGRSLGIELSNMKIDLVPTALPSNDMSQIIIDIFNDYSNHEDVFSSEEDFYDKIVQKAKEDDNWKEDYLMIPDRKAEKWDFTHPLEQIRWANEKNKKTNYNYKKVVRAMKWWNNNYVQIEGMKSYPLEHFIGEYCPNNDDYNLERTIYETIMAMSRCPETKPILEDIGVPQHDVFARLTEENYQKFREKLVKIAEIANEAFNEGNKYKSSLLWQKIFGEKFPIYPESNKFSNREETSTINTTGRFA